jgi:hypothetical protein
MPPSVPIQSSAAHDTSRLTKVPISTRKKAAYKSERSDGKKVSNKTRLTSANRIEEDSQEQSITTPASQSENNALGLYNSTNMMPSSMPYGGMGGSPYGGMMGGGMMGGGMMGGGMMGGGMMGGPFSGLYQVLFGVQNVVFSIGQAVQVLGMNQQALQQAFDSLTSMMDHAIATFHELRALEAMQTEKETEEQKKRRRRLKAIRWALVMGSSWLVFKIIRRLTSRRRRLQYDGSQALTRTGGGYTSSPYGDTGGGAYGSSMYGPSVHGGGGIYGPSMHGGYNPGTSFGGSSMFGGGGHYGSSGSNF